jgi:anti-sigma factor NepR-like protein
MSTNCGECGEPDKRDDIGPHGTGPNVGLDLKAVRTGIGAELRTLHSDVLREEVPDGMAELLRQLDQQRDADSIWRPLVRAEKG